MKSRQLTENEIALARCVFGDAIDYAAVRVHKGKYRFFQGRHTAMSPDGHLYMHALYSQDYALEKGSEARRLFIHEMAHVWQYQNKILDPLRAGVKLMLKHKFNYGASYPYRLDPRRDLLDYNMEQQASIIEDCYMMVCEGRVFNPGKCRTGVSDRERVDLYRQVLQKFAHNPAYAKRDSFPKKQKKPRQKGNALFLVLLAVALFAALSYAITQSSRGSGSVSREEAALRAATITQMGAALRSATGRMLLTGGSLNTLELYTGTNDTPCTAGTNCLFSTAGGGTTPPDLPPAAFTGTPEFYFMQMSDAVAADDIGTATADIIAEFRYLKQDVCAAINSGLGISGIPTPTLVTIPGESSGCFDSGGTYTYYIVLVEN